MADDSDCSTGAKKRPATGNASRVSKRPAVDAIGDGGTDSNSKKRDGNGDGYVRLGCGYLSLGKTTGCVLIEDAECLPGLQEQLDVSVVRVRPGMEDQHHYFIRPNGFDGSKGFVAVHCGPRAHKRFQQVGSEYAGLAFMMFCLNEGRCFCCNVRIILFWKALLCFFDSLL